ncbi:MAG: 23S rRNA (pseudouridine(1915)-N(3))-methyltransferase RlmH [Gammaproteobacteria bacterium]|nr:23S rRNA (pseudouridine(1915)-N(3))-methyltransferase RlmH [Gammaproteobacteria bacterium]TVQ49295.1 MAG: 23S rRNA (pseudouridine(1915)-N(3))-methyltransferase RlmH [Gammaproteobacteria bacterium]
MRFRVLAVGPRQPAWVTEGVEEYRRRLPGLEVVELPLSRRAKGQPPGPARDDEGRRLLARLGPQDHVVALEVDGATHDTAALARRVEVWLGLGRPVSFLIGGPDGLSAGVRARAEESWSLSPLTLPHGLARVVLTEALYRAWSVLQGHPYHRD